MKTILLTLFALVATVRFVESLSCLCDNVECQAPIGCTGKIVSNHFKIPLSVYFNLNNIFFVNKIQEPNHSFWTLGRKLLKCYFVAFLCSSNNVFDQNDKVSMGHAS